MSSGRSSGWSLNQMYAQISSKWFLVIPFFPNHGAGTYFDDSTLDHNVILDKNSNSVLRIITPETFSISPIVVSGF